MSWYLVGPDKTGFDCSFCCAAFYDSYGSCLIKSCEVSGSSVFRDYLCPNPSFPTSLHYYQLNPANNTATIAPNPRKCTTVTSECATYTPSTGLNAAGRSGSGCVQVYVTSNTSCYNSTSACGLLGCNEACGYEQIGAIVYPRACNPNGGACTCSSVGSSVNTCACVCANPNPEWNNTCCNPNPGEACYCDTEGGSGCVTCPDGTVVCFGLPCPCEGSALPNPPCNFCEELTCPGPGGTYYCAQRQCYPQCGAGYECSCGVCVCNAASTCCVGDQWGYSFDPETKQCRSCGYGHSSAITCCATNYIRKGCSNEDSICCNDGLCYQASTTLCQY